MSLATDQFQRNFHCAKCRGRQAHVREIVIPKSGVLDLLPSRDNRYIEVTCTLCGYTEFYNRALFMAALSAEKAAAKAPPKPAED